MSSPGSLPQDFHADRALAGDHVRIVERMDEGELPFARERHRMLVRLVVVIAVQHGFAAKIDHGLHLDLRRRLRHHDRGRNPAAPRRQRDALGMIARRRADHAALRRRVGQVRDLVVGPAHLEREHGLQVLALEKNVVAQATTETRRRFERRFDGDVIDARLEDAFEVVVRHAGEDRVVYEGYGSRKSAARAHPARRAAAATVIGGNPRSIVSQRRRAFLR